MGKFNFKFNNGFTIVELLIVIVVIAILSVVTIVSYNGIINRARQSKISEDFASLQKAIIAARDNTGKTLSGITGSTYTAYNCTLKTAGTDLAALSSNDSCWTTYKLTLSRISVASGIDVTQMVDPWGRPYFIDENESEGGNCGLDRIAIYTNPFNGASTVNSTAVSIPLSGHSGCT